MKQNKNAEHKIDSLTINQTHGWFISFVCFFWRKKKNEENKNKRKETKKEFLVSCGGCCCYCTGLRLAERYPSVRRYYKLASQLEGKQQQRLSKWRENLRLCSEGRASLRRRNQNRKAKKKINKKKNEIKKKEWRGRRRSPEGCYSLLAGFF